ncbi:VOC family protein [Plantactinospora sonchi]|uniref:VOC family protein n=1 Tax=Plantactinospora sonchi TaxID=1544735 RepID=A0ABU7S4K9_9ACTN
MADGRRRQVAPVRKLVAAVLGTLATFVMLFGLGMRSWAIVMLGVALLALAIGLVAFTAVRSGPRAWVTGIGHVHSVTEPPASSAFGRCELQIVIDAPGVPARSVKIRDPRVPVSKWPDPGATLPIMVAIDDQRHVRILWDEVLTHAEAAAGADLPPPFEGLDPLGDEILIEQETPPWARGGRDDPYPDAPLDDPLVDLPDEGLGRPFHDEGLGRPFHDEDLGRPFHDDQLPRHDDRRPVVEDPDPLDDNPPPLRDDLGTHRDEPVVVRQTPGGTIVLEGTLVEPPPPTTTPLPRRPRPGPNGESRRPSPGPTVETAGTTYSAATVPGSVDPDGPTFQSPAPEQTPRTADAAPPPFTPPSGTPAAAPGPASTATRSGPASTASASAPASTGVPSTATVRPTGPSPAPGQRSGGPAEDIEIDIDLDDPGPGSAAGAAQPDPVAGHGTAGSGPAAPSGDDEAILEDLIATPPPARLGESGSIAGVGITLLVTDLERSISFYRDLLGFFEIDGGDGNAILASGGTRLVLRAIREVAPINRRLVHLNLEVNDVHAVHDELVGKGVKFTYAPRAVNRGAKLELWAAAFRDPDGHGIALTQWRDRATG